MKHNVNINQTTFSNKSLVKNIVSNPPELLGAGLELLKLVENSGISIKSDIERFGDAFLKQAIQTLLFKPSVGLNAIQIILNHFPDSELERKFQSYFFNYPKKFTLLEVASHIGITELVQELLERGATATIDQALIAAAQSENPNAEIIKCLLDRGANPGADIGGGISVLDYVSENHPNLMTLFNGSSELGAVIDSSGAGAGAGAGAGVGLGSASAANGERNSMAPNKYFITAASCSPEYGQVGTGDVDYFNTIAEAITVAGEQPHKLEGFKDETRLFQAIKNNTRPGQTPVLHLMINPPYTGMLISAEKLAEFKASGGKVILTLLEFAKLGHNHKAAAVPYMQCADSLIFLDDNDKKNARDSLAGIDDKPLSSYHVINVPATATVRLSPIKERGGNILSFGMIRRGKGLLHIVKLARKIHASTDPHMCNKKILVVGSIGKVQQDNNDRSLLKLMRGVYPDQQHRFAGKKTYELIDILQDIKSDTSIIPALPIEIHVNVPKKNLASLFERCTYSYLPAYRGATLRNSSISTSLANKFITYVHEGKITPQCLKPSGAHADAVILIPHKEDQGFYDYSADTVFNDILMRENDPTINATTSNALNELVDDQILLTSVAVQHQSVYNTVTQPAKLVSSVKQAQPAQSDDVISDLDETKVYDSMATNANDHGVTVDRILERKNDDVRQDGGIPIACPVVPRADTINYLLEQKSNADAVKQINAVRDAAAEYLSWMDEAKITGTRFITRWHHFYPGDSGRKRAKYILDVINLGETSFEDLQKLVCAAFQQSSLGEHAFSRYLYNKLVGDANRTSRYQAYLKEFAAESDDAEYFDDYEQPLSQFEYLKDQANVDPDSIELFKQAAPVAIQRAPSRIF